VSAISSEKVPGNTNRNQDDYDGNHDNGYTRFGLGVFLNDLIIRWIRLLLNEFHIFLSVIFRHRYDL
jgi:hypothetical protein